MHCLYFALRENRDGWQFAANHRDFVAVVEARANAAVFGNLVGNLIALGDRKSQLGEEFWSAREKANRSDAMPVSLCEESLHQSAAAAFALLSWVNRDRTNFRQVRAVKMERTATDDLAFIFEHDEVADVLANFR